MMKRSFTTITGLILTTSLSISSAVAQVDTSQIGRYLTVPAKPKPGQLDLLTQQIQVRFPQNVQTVGEAINYLLRFSGYALVSHEHRSQALETILSKPLPLVDRELGPVSMKEGLIILSGPAFILVQDPINRVIDFRVKQAFLKKLKVSEKENRSH